MFCSKCGSAIQRKSAFCSACGNKVVASELKKVTETANKAKAEKPSKPATRHRFSVTRVNGLLSVLVSKMGKKTLWIFSSLLASALVAILGFVFVFPKPMYVNIEAQPLGEFSFDSACNPINERTDLADTVTINIYDGPTFIDETKSVAGTWSKSGDKCVFAGSTSIPRNAVLYSINVLTEDTVFTVINRTDPNSPATVSAEIGRTHVLSGDLLVANKLQSYDMADCRSAYQRLGAGTCGSVYWNVFGSVCRGAFGFSDLGEGTVVTVSNEDGTTIATGALREAFLSYSDAVRNINEDERLDCTMRFVLENVPSISRYFIEISDRGKRTFTLEELEAAGWDISLQIGE